MTAGMRRAPRAHRAKWDVDDVLLEHLPLDEIVAYFAAQGLQPRLHAEAPPKPTRQERRKLLRELRDGPPPYAHWVALGSVARWYGGGDTEEDALRSAARRWRIEQIGTDNQRKPGDPLP